MDSEALSAAGGATATSLSIFDPASPGTEAIVRLSVLTIAIFALILAVVEGILLYNVWRFRRRAGDSKAEPAQVYGSQPIEIAWTAAPTLIVFFLTLVITRTLWEVKTPMPAVSADDRTLFVTVTGRQWWWEYAYESYDGRALRFTTAGELHVPASQSGIARRVYLTLESADVCHSFWVPRLAGKTDLIPGRTNELSFQTTEQGLFLGQCAEYCGTQHANMLIRVVVDSPAEFDRWLEQQQQPAVDEPQARAGQQAFLSFSCVKCHRIRGTSADGDFAPDLTHLMSRRTLASGELENTPENLERWIRDPQTLKPGCLMPAFGLGDRDRELIVQYLTTLR